MTNPQNMAVLAVENYIRQHLDKSDPTPDFEVYVVWQCYILGNWKCLVSSTLPDGMYKKFENIEITL